jgi:hypothetical protein
MWFVYQAMTTSVDQYERRKNMNLVNFIVWLSAGAVIGWFASRMVQAQRKRVPKTNSAEGP